MSRENRSRNEHRCDDGLTLNRPCRSPLLRSGPLPLKELVPHMKIVTDPKRLALLKAEAARRKQIAGRNCQVTGRRPII
jgi:hypothetical protein